MTFFTNAEIHHPIIPHTKCHRFAAGASDIENKQQKADDRRANQEAERKQKLSEHFAKVDSAKPS